MNEIKEERQHGDVLEHMHNEYDYWHPASRVHTSDNEQEKTLPAGYVVSKKPLAEKLILDLVEVTPIQRMEIGKDLEIGAVISMLEGLSRRDKGGTEMVSCSGCGGEVTPHVIIRKDALKIGGEPVLQIGDML